ncbi:hypothetical protein MJO28_012163 [Puccinia striiformis f. sp. tritici]|uniref:Holocytochrome c-type synthase n=3 Tax=Puccinia striiformis TaxID=27350 RepID=A0A2S4UAA5_9BASI|nr:hypothetical protein MJO28_012163 [Puccinia striiformis f. sp. tritici]POV93976.1 hypothetical protein PSTT_17095 [Puccinia striiformis]POV94217.1 hypothetical protein PSHT_16351 [Puccinia striiformis]
MGNSQSMPQHQEDSSSKLSQCPVHQLNNEQQTTTKINKNNNIPELAQAPSPGQRTKLSLDRTLSSIPLPSKSRSSSSSGSFGENSNLSACPINHQTGEINQRKNKEKDTWVYPSPQQFYNALVRKGWETPEEAIPIMVDIHNWMNEAVWNEVLRWESKYFFKPSSLPSSSTTKFTPIDQPEISLVKFQGRPNELSPKARFNILLSKIFPNLYNDIKPFDRHDWSIRREHLFSNDDNQQQIEKSKLNRYVIDYYNGGVDEHGNPVFHFDVRPAIDDFDSLVVRLEEWARVKNKSWFTNATTTSNSPHSKINSTSINVDTDSKI